MSIYYLVHAKKVCAKTMNHNEKKTIHWSKSNMGTEK